MLVGLVLGLRFELRSGDPKSFPRPSCYNWILIKPFNVIQCCLISFIFSNVLDLLYTFHVLTTLEFSKIIVRNMKKRVSDGRLS